MRTISLITTLTIIYALVPMSSAFAIEADLAKKCRAMAINAHPPTRPGTKSYAQAERDFFTLCVSRNGDIQNNSAQKKGPPSGQ